MKRLTALTTTFYKPDKCEQGIYDICVVTNDSSFKIVSILEGSSIDIVASTLRTLADALDDKK